MKIKRFFAADIRQAMRMVKDELGADAVIMSNKSVDGGVEIVAARDFDEQVLHKNMQGEAGAASSAAITEKPTKSLDLPDYAAEKDRLHIVTSPRKREAPEMSARPARREVDSYLGYAEKTPLVRKEVPAPAKTSAEISRPEAQALRKNPGFEQRVAPPAKSVERNVKPAAKPAEVKTVDFKAVIDKKEPEMRESESEKFMQQMRKELRQLKQSMDMRLAEVGFAHNAQNNPVRLDLLHRLADMGIYKKLSLKLANRLGAHKDIDYAFEKAQEMMAKVLPIAEENILEYGGVVALVGPTGVGKTTTIAKLAAKFILKHGSRQVALITTDNYRIAAHEQLNTYGRILDVPVRTAANADELRSLINTFCDKKLILIDTAGMGPRDMRLAAQLMTLQKNDIPVRSYLVMSATTQYKAMLDIIKAFQVFEPVACILTKMDEAVAKGAAVSALIEQQLPLAFMTDGQQVPEDIHVPRAQALINQCVAELDLENDYTDTINYEDWVAEGYA